MARERLITPGFYKNAKLAKLPLVTRIFWPGIWTVSDFDGIFLWEPEELAMKLLPREDFDPIQAIDSLEASGFLKSYVVEGSKYGYTVNWHKYQKCHPDEACVYPRPIGDLDFIVRIKPAINRKPRDKNRMEDLAYGIPDVLPGKMSYVEYSNNMKTSGLHVLDQCVTNSQSMANSAIPSIPSVPSVPSVPPVPPVPPDASLRNQSNEDHESCVNDVSITDRSKKMEMTPDEDNSKYDGIDSPNASIEVPLPNLKKETQFVYPEVKPKDFYKDCWVTTLYWWGSFLKLHPDRFSPKKSDLPNLEIMIRDYCKFDYLWCVKLRSALVWADLHPEIIKFTSIKYLFIQNGAILNEWAARQQYESYEISPVIVENKFLWARFEYDNEIPAGKKRPEVNPKGDAWSRSEFFNTWQEVESLDGEWDLFYAYAK